MAGVRGTRRQWCGWTAVLASTGIAAFWAFWGAAETFHEGWYFHSIWRNIALSVGQYFLPMLLSMGAALIALWRPTAGVLVHAAGAAIAIWLFRAMPVGLHLVAWPLLALAGAYGYGRPEPRAWARRIVIAVPVAVAIATGAYPGWRVLTRPRDVDLSMRRISGNGVTLVWAPEGPGWGTTGLDWFEANRRCDQLSADGRTLSTSPLHVWRLPSVAEAVRSMIYRDKNAGGIWDPVARRASYAVLPDKDAPLWNRYSPVIYWWTADEADSERAYRIAYNGGVLVLPKRMNRGYFAARCVKEPD